MGENSSSVSHSLFSFRNIDADLTLLALFCATLEAVISLSARIGQHDFPIAADLEGDWKYQKLNHL